MADEDRISAPADVMACTGMDGPFEVYRVCGSCEVSVVVRSVGNGDDHVDILACPDEAVTTAAKEN